MKKKKKKYLEITEIDRFTSLPTFPATTTSMSRKLSEFPLRDPSFLDPSKNSPFNFPI